MSLPNQLAHSLFVSSTFTYRKRAVSEQQSLARRLPVAQRRVCALFPSPRMTASVCDDRHVRVLHSPSAIDWDGHNTKPTKSLLVSVRARETVYRGPRGPLSRAADDLQTRAGTEGSRKRVPRVPGGYFEGRNARPSSYEEQPTGCSLLFGPRGRV